NIDILNVVNRRFFESIALYFAPVFSKKGELTYEMV
ncbi:hypothetical protein NT06LI_1239, partial [Listeria innocua FSL J1-023]